jgi:hypothetical protein
MPEYIINPCPSEYDPEMASYVMREKILVDGEWVESPSYHRVCTDELTEIVRCRDCKWYEQSEINNALSCWCDCHEHNVDPDGFCAWGERK